MHSPLRLYRLQRRAMCTAAIKFTPKATPATRETARALLTSPSPWILSRAGTGLEKTYKFPSFAKVMEFVTSVAEESEKKKHHPEWANVYDLVTICWTTHAPPGLGGKDVAMAGFCDREAEKAGAAGMAVERRNKDGQEEKDLLGRLVEGGACGACAVGSKNSKKKSA